MRKNITRFLSVTLIAVLFCTLSCAVSLAEGAVSILCNRTELVPGQSITLTAETSGFADLPMLYQWQLNKGESWVDIKNATSREYTFTYTDTMADFEWRVIASIDESALIPEQPESKPSESAESEDHSPNLPAESGDGTDVTPENPSADDLDGLDEYPLDGDTANPDENFQIDNLPFEDLPNDSHDPEQGSDTTPKDMQTNNSESTEAQVSITAPDAEPTGDMDAAEKAIQQQQLDPEPESERPAPQQDPAPAPKPDPEPAPPSSSPVEFTDLEPPLAAGLDVDGDGEIDIIWSIENPVSGDIVTLSTPLTNVENTEGLEFQWYCDKGDGMGSQPIEGAIEKDYTFTYADELAGYRFRLDVRPSVWDAVS